MDMYRVGSVLWFPCVAIAACTGLWAVIDSNNEVRRYNASRPACERLTGGEYSREIRSGKVDFSDKVRLGIVGGSAALGLLFYGFGPGRDEDATAS